MRTIGLLFCSNGITLQNAVSLIAQDFLNKRYDKNILKKTCKLVLSNRTIAHVPVHYDSYQKHLRYRKTTKY